MPIQGKDLREATKQFTEHLNSVLNRTVTTYRLIHVIQPQTGRAYIHFRGPDGQPQAMPIVTRFGQMGLTISHYCEASRDREDDRLLTLHTVEYRYALTPEGNKEPIFRWEYVRDRHSSDAYWARHHIQGPIHIDLASEIVNLQDFHLPTGWVPIEEILRFCINDLGVKPLLEHDPQEEVRDENDPDEETPLWDRILEDSYNKFKTDFSPLGER